MNLNPNSSRINYLPWIYLFGVLGLTWWVYSLTPNFLLLLWDDDKYITDNPLFFTPPKGNIWKAIIAGNYHPLTLISLRLDKQFGEIYHLTNVVLHLLNTTLVFILFRLFKFKPWGSLFAALIFGIHPLHVESVAWVSERKDVLYTAFLLGSWIVYLISSTNKGLPNKFIYVISILLFILACLSKGMAMVLPFLIIIELYFRRGNLKLEFIRLIPFFCVSVFFAGVAIWAQGQFSAIRLATDFTTLQKISFPFYGWFFYLIKSIYCWKLSAVYPYPTITLAGLPWYFMAAPFGFMAILFFLWIFRKTSFLLSGFLLYTVALLPVLQIIPVGNAITADRYFYLSSIGVLYIICFFWDKWKAIKLEIYLKAILFLGITLSLSIVARERTKVWQNSRVLFTDVVQQFPQVAVAQYNLGITYALEKQFSSALICYLNATQANPGYADAWTNLGVTYLELGRNEESVGPLLRALEISPTHVDALNNLGVAYERLGNYSEALKTYRKGLVYNPGKLELYNNIGFMFEKTNVLDSAKYYYETALKLSPGYAMAMVNMGNILLRLGISQDSADVWFINAAKAGHPGAQDFLRNRGIVW